MVYAPTKGNCHNKVYYILRHFSEKMTRKGSKIKEHRKGKRRDTKRKTQAEDQSPPEKQRKTETKNQEYDSQETSMPLESETTGAFKCNF